MKAIVIEKFGGPEQLKLAEVPTPHPAPDEVQIKLAYTAVNPVDWKIRMGLLQTRATHDFPIILGWDASGTVSAVGNKVTKFKLGDAVFAYCRKPIVKWGTYAEYVCVPADYLAIKPQNISFAQTASLPLSGLTAWQSLFDSAKLKKGEMILIHAGAGGVGSLAIQFAKNAGAIVITTATALKHDYVKSLGADYIIDYTKEDFVERIKEINPQKIDVVFDTIGGQSLIASYQVLKPNGRLVSLLEQPKEDLEKKYGVKASYVFVSPNGSELQQIADLITSGKVKPPEIIQMPLENAAEAQEQNKEGHTKGKIVLKIS